METVAQMERQAYESWRDFRSLESMAAGLARLPLRHAVTNRRVLQRLAAPRNTRAGVLYKRAHAMCAQVRQEALSQAVACFEDLFELKNAVGRCLDIVPDRGPTRRLLLDEVFVVTAPTYVWVSSSQYELHGADLEADQRAEVLRTDRQATVLDMSP